MPVGTICQGTSGNIRDISIFGQESNPTTWKLAKMNLAIRQLEANLGKHNADSFHDDQHKMLKANYILANPPFNISDWGGERLREDIRWKYGVPPVGNANFAWLQHMLYHLNPAGGVAGTVLANGSLSSNTSNEGIIRANMVKSDVVECIVGIEQEEEDKEPFEEKMQRLTSELSGLFAQSHELEEEIRKKLGAIGYEL